jgi:hypothetical protein
MKVLSSKKLPDNLVEKIVKEVQKKIKPTSCIVSNITVKVDKLEITGDYRNALDQAFEIRKITGDLPVSDPDQSDNFLKDLKKKTKPQLIAICKDLVIEIPDGATKPVIFDLIVSNYKGE